MTLRRKNSLPAISRLVSSLTTNTGREEECIRGRSAGAHSLVLKGDFLVKNWDLDLNLPINFIVAIRAQ